MTKICLFNHITKQVIDYLVTDSIAPQETSINESIANLYRKNRITKENVANIVTTGYGKKNYTHATISFSEIICHALGVSFFYPIIKTVIDIGGQDTKIIKLLTNGRVNDFYMNDKCAAGTGRFLERVAELLHIPLQELGEYATRAELSLDISSTCAVFIESEIINLLSLGEKKVNIIRSVNLSLVHSIMGMMSKVGLEYPVAFVGGVAKNQGVITALEEYLETKVHVPEHPEITGAIGAAILGGLYKSNEQQK